jgi:signal transduction histidine kinase
MMLFNIWHFVVLAVIFVLFILGAVASLKQDSKKMVFSMLFSVTLVTVFLAIFSVIVVDKYTKKVELYKLKNKRILSIEKIVYSGTVKNTGNYPIGEVTFEIKLVNKGHATGNVKGGNFYKPSGFLDFFSSGLGISNKPQSITKKFIVAKNLQPGEVKAFRVYFRYPPYFRSTSQFANVYGH